MSDNAESDAGDRKPQSWFREEYERAKRLTSLIPPHARMVVTSPTLSAHTRDTPPGEMVEESFRGDAGDRTYNPIEPAAARTVVTRDGHVTEFNAQGDDEARAYRAGWADCLAEIRDEDSLTRDIPPGETAR